MNLKDKLKELAHKECKKNKVKLYLGRGKSVKYPIGNIRVNGFFNFDVDTTTTPILACATGRPNWELVLVHELCHMRQWKDNCKVWRNYCQDHHNFMDISLSGKYVNPKKLAKEAYIALLMEHDCEQRAHHLLSELGYSKQKLIEYIQKSNAYALFYLYVAQHNKWYEVGKEPYNLKNVWKHFPKTFDIDIDKEFFRLHKHFDQCVK